MSHKYYKDLLAIFVCLLIVIISSFLTGKADSGANVSFTADTIINLSGTDTILYALSGSEADSITISGSTLTVEIPASSYFTIGIGSNTVLKITPSGNTVSLIFDTVYLSGGYVSQWTITCSGTGVSFLVGVPEANTDYLVKANGEKLNYFKSTGAKEISFSYSGDLTRKAFEVIRGNQPSSGGLPATAFQAPSQPKQGFTVSINNGAEKTNAREVVLTLNGGPDAKRMSISENKDFAEASQESYTTSRTWTFSASEGLKTIYVKFFTEYGQPTEVITDSIVLETVIPQPVQEESETENVVEEEPVITPTSTPQQVVKQEQPKTPAKTVTPGKTSSPAKTTTVPAKEPIMPKIIVDDTLSSPADEKVADDEITSSVEPKIISEEQTVPPQKNNNESVNAEKSILTSLWQAVVSLLRRMWPF